MAYSAHMCWTLEKAILYFYLDILGLLKGLSFKCLCFHDQTIKARMVDTDVPTIVAADLPVLIKEKNRMGANSISLLSIFYMKIIKKLARGKGIMRNSINIISLLPYRKWEQ